MGRVAWPSSCSRNAHDQNVLVRRAQSRIDQATLELELGSRRCAQWKIWETLEVRGWRHGECLRLEVGGGSWERLRSGDVGGLRFEVGGRKRRKVEGKRALEGKAE